MQQFSRIRENPLIQRRIHHHIDQARCTGLIGPDTAAGQNQVEREVYANQPRKTLCPKRSRQEAQLYFRKAELRSRGRHAPVARQCQLQAAAKHRAVQGSDHRPLLCLQSCQQRIERRRRERTVVEGGDIAARHEGTAVAGDDQGAGRTVGLEQIKCLGEASNDGRRNRIHGRVVDAQHRDVATAHESHGFPGGWRIHRVGSAGAAEEYFRSSSFAI